MESDVVTLRHTGALLFGPEWQTPLGALVGRTARTVRAWDAGGPIPCEVWPVLSRACRNQAVAFQKRAATLRALAPVIAKRNQTRAA
jgi:hypothetical protein